MVEIDRLGENLALPIAFEKLNSITIGKNTYKKRIHERINRLFAENPNSQFANKAVKVLAYMAARDAMIKAGASWQNVGSFNASITQRGLFNEYKLFVEVHIDDQVYDVEQTFPLLRAVTEIEDQAKIIDPHLSSSSSPIFISSPHHSPNISSSSPTHSASFSLTPPHSSNSSSSSNSLSSMNLNLGNGLSLDLDLRPSPPTNKDYWEKKGSLEVSAGIKAPFVFDKLDTLNIGSNIGKSRIANRIYQFLGEVDASQEVLTVLAYMAANIAVKKAKARPDDLEVFHANIAKVPKEQGFFFLQVIATINGKEYEVHRKFSGPEEVKTSAAAILASKS